MKHVSHIIFPLLPKTGVTGPLKTGYRLFLLAFLFTLTSPTVITAASEDRHGYLTVSFEGVEDTENVPLPWRIKVNKGAAGASVVEDRGENILRLHCRDSSFGVERALSVSPVNYPVVSWTWNAVKLPESGDVRNPSMNDQALQLLFLFEGNVIISYVWDSNAPEGTITDESPGWPLGLRVKVLVVSSGHPRSHGAWRTVRRNILEDYRRLFGKNPSGLVGLRIQANTQYTHSSSEGLIKSIIFSDS